MMKTQIRLATILISSLRIFNKKRNLMGGPFFITRIFYQLKDQPQPLQPLLSQSLLTPRRSM